MIRHPATIWRRAACMDFSIDFEGYRGFKSGSLRQAVSYVADSPAAATEIAACARVPSDLKNPENRISRRARAAKQNFSPGGGRSVSFTGNSLLRSGERGGPGSSSKCRSTGNAIHYLPPGR